MKKTVYLLIMAAVAASLSAGCGGTADISQNAEKNETEAVMDNTQKDNPAKNNPTLGGEIFDDTMITVFAAEGMETVMEELVIEYNKLRPTVTVVCSYKGLDDLEKMIQEGAACDVLFAAEELLGRLEEEGLFYHDSRITVFAGAENDLAAAQVVNGDADELERNAAADFILFLASDTAKEILSRGGE